MPRLPALVFALLLLPGAPVGAARADDAPPEGSKLAALAFLVGERHGQGEEANGRFAYDETITGAWILGGQALELRSQSTAGGQVVFRDRRVISYDTTTKTWRMRQWGEGRVRVYTGTQTDGAFVFEETAQEVAEGGSAAPAWRYAFTPSEDGFTYTLEQKVGGAWTDFLSARHGTQRKDPGQGGGLGIRQYDARAAGMAAQIHHPDGKGPYPLLVFSPGGNASSFQGYRPYGRWFATWGYVTVIVAFDDENAGERAGKFTKVIDWAHGECEREGSPLHGMLDKDKVATVGHSRGGAAALIAGTQDARVDAVLALAPSGPTEAPEGANAPKACVIIGDGDRFLPAATRAYGFQKGERFKVVIDGLTHMLQPREPVLRLVRRSTSFLEYALKGDARYREPLVETQNGIAVETAAAGGPGADEGR